MRKIVTILLVLVCGGAALWDLESSKSAFNEYLEPLQPVLTRQAGIAEALGAAAGAITDDDSAAETELAASLTEWIAEARTLQAQVDATTPTDPEIAAIHAHMRTQAKAFTQSLEALLELANGDESATTRAEALGQQRNDALDKFINARDAYFSDHNLQVRE